MKKLAWLGVVVAAFAAVAVAAPPPRPPVAKKVAHTVTIHGAARRDDYFWLREKDSAAVRTYLAAENAYTEAFLAPTKPLEEQLYREAVAHIVEDDDGVAHREGNWLYWRRTRKGKEHPIFMRRPTAGGPEQVLLDVNALGQGKPFIEVAVLHVSDDGNLLCYTVDDTGAESYTLRVVDLRSGALLPDTLKDVDGFALGADGKTIFYVVLEPKTHRPYRLLMHALGATGPDPLLYEEKDPNFDLEVTRTRNKRFIAVGSTAKTSSEWRFVRADRPGDPLRLIAPREPDHLYEVVGAHGDDLVLTSDAGGRRNFRAVLAAAADPAPAKWRELVPHRPEVLIEDVAVFADFYVVEEVEHALQRLRIVAWKTGASRTIDMPEPAYALSSAANAEYDTTTYRFEYESLVTPESTFEVDVKTGARKLVKRLEVPGYDPARLVTERLAARAADGTAIPISIVRPKDAPKDGTMPLLLHGYGSYGHPVWPWFSESRLSLLDRGVGFAIAHIRGGGEGGRRWHDQARMLSKRTTFTDFIAAAEHLVAAKVTAKDRLAIRGRSAGGMLMGAVTNMRPDLFKVVEAQVPFVDVVNTMLDESLPLTTQEFTEWGNPKEKAAYDYMMTYSPYDNVARQAYPAIFARGSLDDTRVSYWEPAKWVAKLRAMKTDRNPLLLLINLHAGHGGASGRYELLREEAMDDAFLLTQLGVVR